MTWRAFILCLFAASAAWGASFNPPKVFDTLATLTNSTPVSSAPVCVVIQGGTNQLWWYSSQSIAPLSSSVLMPKSGVGRWLNYAPIGTGGGGGTTYTAGDGIDVTGSVISGKYLPGTGLQSATNSGAVTFTATNVPQANVTGLTNALAGKQPLDPDLTTLAGLTPANGDLLSYNSGWNLLPVNATAGKLLTSVGGSAPPAWSDISLGVPANFQVGTNLHASNLVAKTLTIVHPWTTSSGLLADVNTPIFSYQGLNNSTVTWQIQNANSGNAANVRIFQATVGANGQLVTYPTAFSTATLAGRTTVENSAAGMTVRVNAGDFRIDAGGGANNLIVTNGLTTINTAATALRAPIGTPVYVLGVTNDATSAAQYLVTVAASSLGGGGGITDAPSTAGVPYGREAGAWTNLNVAITNRVTAQLAASPALGGTPTAPTAVPRDSSTLVATTAFVGGLAGGPSSYSIWDDLLNNAGTAGDKGSSGTSNSGQVNAIVATAGRPGQRNLVTTAANQGPLFGWIFASFAMRLPAVAAVDQFYYETGLQMPSILSGSGASGVDQYAIQAGFLNVLTGTNLPTMGSYLTHQTNLIANQNWVFVTTTNGVPATAVDTGVAVTANTWYRLGVYLDATNTYAYINGNRVGTNTTQMPLNQFIAPVTRMTRYSGTTTATMNLDWVALDWRGAAR